MTRVADRHKWNETFEWVPSAGPLKRLTREQADAYDEQGFFVFEDAFDPDLVTRIREEIDPYEEKSTEWLRSKGGSVMISDADAITFTTHLVTKSDFLKEVCSTGVLADIAHDRGTRDEVGRERDRVGFGDEHAVVGLGAEERLELGLEAVDLGDDRFEVVGCDGILDDDVAAPVELRGLRVGEAAERSGQRLPTEVGVPRMPGERVEVPQEM